MTLSCDCCDFIGVSTYRYDDEIGPNFEDKKYTEMASFNEFSDFKPCLVNMPNDPGLYVHPFRPGGKGTVWMYNEEMTKDWLRDNFTQTSWRSPYSIWTLKHGIVTIDEGIAYAIKDEDDETDREALGEVSRPILMLD